MSRNIVTPPEVANLLASHVPVILGTSGGKDSMAVALAVAKALENYPGPKLLLHADLGLTEWHDSWPSCQRLAEKTGIALESCTRPAGGMMERWEGRWKSCIRRYLGLETITVVLPWSTPGMRFCQIELKVDPIARHIKLKFGKVAVLNVTGIRGQESSSRAKQPICSPMPKLPNGSLSWRPIHHWTVEDVWAEIYEAGLEAHEAYSLFGSTRVSCVWCLAGETEVVTRQGIVPIQSLAGKTAELLIPKKTPFGLSGEGLFQKVPVRDLGVQQIWEITLQRGKLKKVIRTTKEHRWLISRKTGRRVTDQTTVEKTTNNLVKGDRLRSLRSHSNQKMEEVPFAVAQGFIFGDGARGNDQRPAYLTIYEPKKLKYFANHVVTFSTSERKPIKIVRSLPRNWKETPPMTESRSFLLSWLSGYFAADGTVTPNGSARLDSANRLGLEFARSVAAICGVGYSSITTTTRTGIRQSEPSEIHHFCINADTVPKWFFKIKHHASLVKNRTGRGEKIDRIWKVVDVRKTNRKETVYCATVPDVAAFGLGDEIMTGNCIMANDNDLRAGLKDERNHPLYLRMCELELTSGFAFQGNRWISSLAPNLIPDGDARLAAAMQLAAARKALEAKIPKHLQLKRGKAEIIPTLAEAKIIAETRIAVCQLYNWEATFTNPEEVIAHFRRSSIQGCDENQTLLAI